MGYLRASHEICQIAINGEPADDPGFDPDDADHDLRAYYPMQDASHFRLGIVDATGVLVERYAFASYGQRTTYISAGANDPDCYLGTLRSQRVQVGDGSGGTLPLAWGLCDIGHQGLMHDEELGGQTALIQNRDRVLHPGLGRYLQHDRLGYVDGMNSFAYYAGMHGGLDPWGQQSGEDHAKTNRSNRRSSRYAKFRQTVAKLVGVRAELYSVLRELGEATARAQEAEGNCPFDIDPLEPLVDRALRLDGRYYSLLLSAHRLSGEINAFYGMFDGTNTARLQYDGIGYSPLAGDFWTVEQHRVLGEALGRAGVQLGQTARTIAFVETTLFWVDVGCSVVATTTGAGLAFKAGGKAALCVWGRRAAAGYVVSQALDVAAMHLDLDPRILTAMDLARTAIALVIARRPCFAPGTLVHTEDGLRPIEDIQPGDRVWAYNHDTGEWELCIVARTFESEYEDEMTELTIARSDGASETISATASHPFWVVSADDAADLATRPLALEHAGSDAYLRAAGGGRYVAAGELRVGDRLLLRDGSFGYVSGVDRHKDHLYVYNLEVAGSHNYAVGEAGTLVHNGCTPTRRQALNQAKARAGVPRSQQPSRQWTVGDDASRAGNKNYRYSRDRGTHGRYYEYDTPQGKRVVAEHTGDPSRGPHIHAGEPKMDSSRTDVDFMAERYMQSGGRHHIDYE